MAGIRDWIRSRSKSRSRGSQEVKQQQQAEQEQESKSLPPLPLLRADSSYRRKQEEAQSQFGSGDAYAHPNQNQEAAPGEQLSPQGGYERISAGDAPQRGTYPLHGNAVSRPPPQYIPASKSPSRASRTFSFNSRRQSAGRPDSVNRQSLPPGTALSTDAPPPISPTTSKRSSSTQRQPVSSLVTDMYNTPSTNTQARSSMGPSNDVSNVPAVPVIPGPYKPQSGAVTSAETQPSSHERVVSISSRVSTSSRTPIAEEFQSGAWYRRNDSPAAPDWSPTRDNLAMQDQNRSPQTLRHQPDVGNLSNEAHARQASSDNPPPRGSSLTNEPPRGRVPRRSLEKPLPVPNELRDAPWNQGTAVPIEEPVGFGGRSDRDIASGTAPVHPRENNRTMDGLTNQLQPLSINSRSLPATDQDQAPSATITDFSDMSHNIPGGFPDGDITPSERHSNANETPFFEASDKSSMNPFVQGEVRDGHSGIVDKSLAVKNSAMEPSLKGIVDLRNTEDTSVHTRNAPAVVHETVNTRVHNIREEQITRDIHTHDVYHRVLPIVDVQVLPARHFVPTSWVPTDSSLHPDNANLHAVNGDMPSKTGLGSSDGDRYEQLNTPSTKSRNEGLGSRDNIDSSTASAITSALGSDKPTLNGTGTSSGTSGMKDALTDGTARVPTGLTASQMAANAEAGFVEVPHTFLPDRTIDAHTNRNWVIAETASKLGSQTDKIVGQPQWRRFTAKEFPGTEGDLKKWTDEAGIKRSEQTWVHKPTHDMEMRDKGLTEPLYMDE